MNKLLLSISVLSLGLLVVAVSPVQTGEPDCDTSSSTSNGPRQSASDSFVGWWSDRFDDFKSAMDDESISSVEIHRVQSGGSFSLYEQEMREAVSDQIALASSHPELSRNEEMTFGWKGEISLGQEAGTSEVMVDPEFDITRDYQRFFQIEGRYPKTLSELFTVIRPPEEWSEKPEMSVYRALLPYYDWKRNSFRHLQRSPEHAQFGDVFLLRLTEEQQQKWFELTGAEVETPDGEKINLRSMETWYWKLYGHEGEVLEGSFHSVIPLPD